MQEQSSQDLATVWDDVREELRGAIPASAFESWLEPLHPVGLHGTRLYVAGPDRVRDWFERRYVSLAVAAARKRIPAITEIVFSDATEPLAEDRAITRGLLDAGIRVVACVRTIA